MANDKMKTISAINEMAVIKDVCAIKIMVMKKKHFAQLPNWDHRLKEESEQLGLVGRSGYKVVVNDVNGHLGFVHEMKIAEWLSSSAGNYDDGWATLEPLPQIFED